MKFKVNVGGGYDVVIKRGCVLEGGLPEGVVITDKNVLKKYKKLVGEKCVVLRAGEESKGCEKIWGFVGKLTEYDVDKIVALGGGVVGDVSGFIASVYQRGIGLIQVPTTLLAMVDSSIGGKNGLNCGLRKNLIGTIYQPEKVLIDPLFLETLPEGEFKNGVAEIIKYGFVFGFPSVERLGGGISLKDGDLEEIIAGCCQTKARIVEIDEKDEGVRHVLNFGHTIGHGIELRYALKHGDAISIGMVKAVEIGEEIGIFEKGKAEELKEILEINSLPTKLPENFDCGGVLRIMKADKKGSFVFAFDKENYNVRLSEKKLREILRRGR